MLEIQDGAILPGSAVRRRWRLRREVASSWSPEFLSTGWFDPIEMDIWDRVSGFIEHLVVAEAPRGSGTEPDPIQTERRCHIGWHQQGEVRLAARGNGGRTEDAN